MACPSYGAPTERRFLTECGATTECQATTECGATTERGTLTGCGAPADGRVAAECGIPTEWSAHCVQSARSAGAEEAAGHAGRRCRGSQAFRQLRFKPTVSRLRVPLHCRFLSRLPAPAQLSLVGSWRAAFPGPP
eukprot:363192-Chlamydomonas_euryale.AAC.19